MSVAAQANRIVARYGKHVMPDRAMELRHLAQAERHISEGEHRVLSVEAAIARAVALGMNVDEAQLSLALIVDGLTAIKAHRLMILKAIDNIDRRLSAQQEDPRIEIPAVHWV